MNRVFIAFFAACLVTSQLAAQVVVFPEPKFGVRQNLEGGACFPPPFYENCIYDDRNSSNVNLYRMWRFQPLANGVEERDRSQPNFAIALPGSPATPTPPATPVLREYHWQEGVETSPTFTIVTTNGTEYLATMVWVEGENLCFNSADGGTHQIPLTSVSRPLTQIANSRKNLSLPLPAGAAGEATSKASEGLGTKGN